MPYTTVIVDKHPQTYGDKDTIDDRLFEHLDNDTQQKVISWIKSNFYHHTSVYRDSNSYGLKHLLEKRTGIYLTSNQFKDSMLMAGFKPYDESDFNWYFRLDPSSPAFAIDANDIAGMLRGFRNEEDMSQSEFARSLNIPLSTYRKWEQGVNIPSHYIFNMIKMIMDYRYRLWEHGVYDDVRFDKEHVACYSWEYSHEVDEYYNYCADYLDIRLYEDKERDCTVFRLYPHAVNSMENNKFMFSEVLQWLLNKYSVSWTIDMDSMINIISSASFLYTYVISVGHNCLGKDIGVDTYVSMERYDGDNAMDFHIRNNIYEHYNAVVWTDAGMKYIVY